MTDKLINFLIELEGLRLSAYPDSVGYYTIGIGHKMTQDELSSGKIVFDDRMIKYDHPITEQEAIDICAKDIKRTSIILGMIESELTENQKIALLSFAFNVGIYAFRHSTLLKKINAGNLKDVPFELRRWIHAGGRIVKGLIIRREKEILKWLEQ